MIYKILKTFISFLLILSLSTNAAIVGDFDGSAFVTKKEFESLKQNFADQLDQYETSLTKKIDGQIASYILGTKVEDKILLENIYAKYDLIGNTNKGVLWSSNYNVTLCSAASQKLAYDYTYVQTYGAIYVADTETDATKTMRRQNSQGGLWHGILDSLSNQRAYRRYKLNKNGRIDGRYIFRSWLFGSMCGMIQQWANHPGGSWFSNGVTAQINSRDVKMYSYNAGHNVVGNHWWGSHNYVYSETFDESTGENVAVYPLSEVETEYVVDMNEKTPTFTEGSRLNFNSSELNFTISNMQQLTGYNGGVAPFTSNNGATNDYLNASISGIFKKKKLASFIYQNFYDKDNSNQEIRSGVVIASVESPGDVIIKGKCNKTGYLILYAKKQSDPLWDEQRLSTSDTSSYKILKNRVTANNEWTRTLEEVGKDNKIFMIYLPDNTSDLGSVEITSLIENKY